MGLTMARMPEALLFGPTLTHILGFQIDPTAVIGETGFLHPLAFLPLCIPGYSIGQNGFAGQVSPFGPADELDPAPSAEGRTQRRGASSPPSAASQHPSQGSHRASMS